MHDAKSNIKLVEHVPAKSRTAGAVNGTGIDTANFTSVSFLISAGTFGASATLDAKLQHSDDNSAWTDVAADIYNDGAATQLTAAGRARLHYSKRLKRYVRVVSTVAVAAVEFGVAAVLAGANHRPVAYGTGE